jgi:hypothetical protein
VVSPAEPLQVLATEAIAVPDAARLLVGGAVCLDGEHHSTRILRVQGSEVDSVPADAILRNHSDSSRRESRSHVSLKGIKVGATRRLLS